MKKGYVECKYTDAHLDKKMVLKYLVRSKDSPLSMIATFTMQNCLKSASEWNSTIVEIKDDDDKAVSEPSDEKLNAMEAKKAKLDLTLNEIKKEKKKMTFEN